MKKAVLCIVETLGQAETLVTQLTQAGFSNNDISALFPDKTGTKDFAHEHNTKAPEGAVAGASVGGVLGGGLGVLVGIGALAIPGLGPFIAAGPLLAGLSGIAAGAAVGGFSGALVGMGIPEIEAKQYEGKLRGGNIIVSVHTDSAEQITQAKKLMKGFGAHDVCSVTEQSTPKPTERQTRA
jgi:hypothetical protein